MINFKPISSMKMSGIVLCPGWYRKYVPEKVPEIGNWTSQWVQKEKGKEQRKKNNTELSYTSNCSQMVKIKRKKYSKASVTTKGM